MEDFIINIIATLGFSVIFTIVFFLLYYIYLKGTVGGIREEGKDEIKDKGLRKRILK